jgi:NAD(P)-dependent dehydrogenase (short-subunit alcohol dehydrogenase family)
MRIKLTAKLALVTGSTGGIGEAIAKGPSATGAQVVVNGRGQQSVDAAIRHIKAEVSGARGRGVAADVASADACSALVEAVPTVDILVNKARVFEPKSFLDIPDEDWLCLFEINVLAGVRLSRAYMAAKLSRDWVCIIFIGLESALNVPNGMIHCGFTEAGELVIARGLAQLIAGTGVAVNSVLPAPTFVKKNRPTSLLQRFARVEEIANMVVYAKEASVTNGAALIVGGGIVQTTVCGEVPIAANNMQRPQLQKSKMIDFGLSLLVSEWKAALASIEGAVLPNPRSCCWNALLLRCVQSQARASGPMASSIGPVFLPDFLDGSDFQGDAGFKAAAKFSLQNRKCSLLQRLSGAATDGEMTMSLWSKPATTAMAVLLSAGVFFPSIGQAKPPRSFTQMQNAQSWQADTLPAANNALVVAAADREDWTGWGGALRGIPELRHGDSAHNQQAETRKRQRSDFEQS